MSLLGRLAGEVRLPLFRNAYALFGSSLISSGLGFVYWAIAGRLAGFRREADTVNLPPAGAAQQQAVRRETA